VSVVFIDYSPTGITYLMGNPIGSFLKQILIMGFIDHQLLAIESKWYSY
jgi:hypothetical protein